MPLQMARAAEDRLADGALRRAAVHVAMRGKRVLAREGLSADVAGEPHGKACRTNNRC